MASRRDDALPNIRGRTINFPSSKKTSSTSSSGTGYYDKPPEHPVMTQPQSPQFLPPVQESSGAFSLSSLMPGFMTSTETSVPPGSSSASQTVVNMPGTGGQAGDDGGDTDEDESAVLLREKKKMKGTTPKRSSSYMRTMPQLSNAPRVQDTPHTYEVSGAQTRTTLMGESSSSGSGEMKTQLKPQKPTDFSTHDDAFPFDPMNPHVDVRQLGRRKAIGTCYILAGTSIALIAFALSVFTYQNSKKNHELLVNNLPLLFKAEHMAEAAQMMEATAQNRFIQMQDQMCFTIGLNCALLQEMFQSSGRGVGQLLKVCADMEVQCASTIQSEIANSGFTRFSAGHCYGLVGKNTEEYLMCIARQPVTFPSIQATGLLPQTTVSRDSSSVPFSSGLYTLNGPSVIPPMSFTNFNAASFYSNPQLGPMFINLEKTLLERDLYGVFISYSYDTLWNRKIIAETLGGGGSGILPDTILPFDGAFYISLNTQSSTTADGHPGSFGRITKVLESSVFDGLGKLYADDQIVVLSGKEAIVGWDISGGLTGATSRPVITRSFLVDSTKDETEDVSLVSPADLRGYVDQETGKRYFLIAMQDIVNSNDPDTLFCTTPDRRPTSCGGFIKLDRDALWQSSPASATSRFTMDGLNNGHVMPTPGDFIVMRERNIIVAGSTLSKLHSAQHPCLPIHAFIVHVLNQTEMVVPDPGYDFEDVVGALDETAHVSFYKYDDGTYLFNLSSLWIDNGDILRTTPAEAPGEPPIITDQNWFFDPNLNVIEEWKYATGHLPILIRKASTVSGVDLPIFYGIDFYTGGIFSVSPTDPTGMSHQSVTSMNVSVPWKLTYVAWLPYIVLGEQYHRPPIHCILDRDTDSCDPAPFMDTQFLPFPTDLKLTSDGRFLFVAANGLGQVVVYKRRDLAQSRLDYCTSVQVTLGQFNHTRVPYISHPSRPGVPLHGGPSSLAVDPSNRFLYVTTGNSFDDCIYPSAAIHGGVVVRYAINSYTCSDQTLVLDTAFLVTSFDLPSNIAAASVPDSGSNPATLASAARGLPARFGEITFPLGDEGSTLLRPGTAGV